MSLDPEIRGRIETLVEDNDVVLFMKGNRGAPQCGFSSTVVQILNTLVPDYSTVDVLADSSIREGIKTFSSWPTVPQLYVKGEFIGGCDIIQEMFQSGELHAKVGIEIADVSPPSIEVTDPAAEALRQAIAQAGNPEGALHLSIDASFQTALSMAPRNAGAIAVESNGVEFFVDALTAPRADGVTIDYVESPNGAGFKIDNPNAPAAPNVQDISVGELKTLIDSGEKFEFLDVRTPEERARASIVGTTLMTDLEAERLESLPRDTAMVFHCQHGGRSRAAAEHFANLGFTRVQNVAGGIDAWSQEIDSEVPRY